MTLVNLLIGIPISRSKLPLQVSYQYQVFDSHKEFFWKVIDDILSVELSRNTENQYTH